MLKRILLLATIAFAALASAQTSGSYGHGVADDGHDRLGAFDYNVSKTDVHEHTSFDGYLNFSEHTHGVTIAMGHPDGLTVVDHACEFTGPGSLTSFDEHGHKFTVHGRVNVHVTDNRNPHHNKGDPDTFRIEFQGDNMTYSFSGFVHDGDLTVFSKH